MGDWVRVLLLVSLWFCSSVLGETDRGDYAVLDEFRKGLSNPELLQWPAGDTDPCGSLWPHVFCSGTRVSQIQVQNMKLSGPLPQDLNKLTMLSNLGLQRNNFSGKLPSFSGLSKLQYAYLSNNMFDTIPSDFFVGLTSLQVLALDNNPLNQSTGWVLPQELQNSAQLMNLSLMQCNLVGSLPDFLGNMSSLAALKLSYNNLNGTIPASLASSALQILWLNNQNGGGLTGSIDVIGSMTSLTDVWLHGNSFNGPIPESIGALTSLTRLWLNNNQLVGLIPESLTQLKQLQSLQLDNNNLMGPIPKLSIQNFTYSFNSFCQSTPGVLCSPEVNALLNFLAGVSYPLTLASSWSGNDPCSSSWRGISCSGNNVYVVSLPNSNLSGTISPSLGEVDSLVDIKLGGNHLTGTIPANLTSLKSLKLLDVSNNNISPPVPTNFSNNVKFQYSGNPLLDSSASPGAPPVNTPSGTPPSPSGSAPPSGTGGSKSGGGTGISSQGSKKLNLAIVVIPVAIGILIILLGSFFIYCRRKGKKSSLRAPSYIVDYPRDPSDPDDMLKTVVSTNAYHSTATNDLRSSVNSGITEVHLIDSGNLVITVQFLRDVTRNFAPENELGRGGFGVVYKGEYPGGKVVAVKRMESSVISNKAFDEFQAEIAVLSKVRHRNLVSLLGFTVEGIEKLLVYEYMPQGALSKHLFQRQKTSMEPLSWKKRLNIALDVARGMEYLHNLAHECFIHRDLKSSNILLGDDFRAKVSDFGLVKLAPDGKNSVATRLAGTFGYLAPEYAVTGKITTKADVFSFGVVLMELVTGLTALDESRPEESRYLASWFYQIKSSREKLRTAIDPSMEVSDETFESICIIAELAGHCAARDPNQRPDMGHVVNVLSPLVGKWKPVSDDTEDCLGIDFQQPLLQMVKGWQDADGTEISSVGLDDSKGSIPARPAGLAASFTSADGR